MTLPLITPVAADTTRSQVLVVPATEWVRCHHTLYRTNCEPLHLLVPLVAGTQGGVINELAAHNKTMGKLAKGPEV